MAKEPYVITADDILNYNRKEKNRHAYYKDSCDLYNKIKIHFTGEFPGQIIEERRPGESEAIRDFRKKYYVCNTKPTVMRVFNSGQKIRKSPDWLVQFNPEAVPSKILPDQTPEIYLNTEYPEHQSLTNWAFSIQLMQQLQDANAFTLTFPRVVDVAANELRRPITVIFNSPNVIDYVLDEFYVFKASEKIKYGKNNTDGSIYYSANTAYVTKWEQTGADVFTPVWIFEHKCEEAPVSQLRGIVTDFNSENVLCESRIQAMVPFLTEAVREYSDLAGLKLYQTPKMWIYKSQECKTCNGDRRITEVVNNTDTRVTCPTCKGQGTAPMNPFELLELKPPTADEVPISGDPMGFITPPVDALRFMEESVAGHYRAALSAINMEYVSDVPLDTSGVSKQYDRQDQENWIHSLGEDIVRVMDRTAWFTVVQRYGYVMNYNYKELKALTPNIPVPEKFDLTSAQDMVDDLTKLKNSGAHPALVNSAQIDLSAKLFPSSPEIKKKFETVIELDPLSGLVSTEISGAVTMGFISEEDAVIHYNITEFLERALIENKQFYELEREQQMAIMVKYAAEQVTVKQAKDKALMNGSTTANTSTPSTGS